jgi:hypothetical protein
MIKAFLDRTAPPAMCIGLFIALAVKSIRVTSEYRASQRIDRLAVVELAFLLCLSILSVWIVRRRRLRLKRQ